MSTVVLGNISGFDGALTAIKSAVPLISDWLVHYDGSSGSFNTPSGTETPSGRWLCLRVKTDNNSVGTSDTSYMYLVIEMRGLEIVLRTAQAVTSSGVATGVTPYANAPKTTLLTTPFNVYLTLSKNAAGIVLAFSSSEVGALLSTYTGVLSGPALDNAYALIDISNPNQAWVPATTGITAGLYGLHTLGENTSSPTVNSVLRYEVGNPVPVSSPARVFLNKPLLGTNPNLLGAMSSVYRTKNAAYETADYTQITEGSTNVILRVVRSGDFLLAIKE